MPLFQTKSKCETILMKMTDLPENKPVGGTHFHMNGFELRLVLTQRQEPTWKWPFFATSVFFITTLVY